MNDLRHVKFFILLVLLLSACSLDLRAWQPAPPTPEPSPVALLPSITPTSSATPSPSPTVTLTPAPPTPTFEPLEPSPTLAPLSSELRERVFQQVWETVRDNYLYEDYRGVDWQAVREEFLPEVAAAQTPEDFYGMMYDLIARLGDDHSRFESPQDIAAQQAEAAGTLRYGGIGAEIRTVDDGGIITSVAPDGPAAQAGIQPRDLVLAVDGIPFIDSEAFGPLGPVGHVRGEPGTTVILTIRSPNESPREVEVIRAVIATNAFTQVTAQRIAETDIGLLTVPSFYVQAVDEHVRDALKGLLADGPLSGLIIDMRSNGGGYVHLMRNTIALFHDGGSIGSTSGRNSSDEQLIPTGMTISELSDVPIVVLIGPDTVSAAEMFAAGMQVLDRAFLVGLPSAGNTENLYAYTFEDGSRILLAEVAYELPDGTLIEERGVLPDVQVEAEWWRYAPADDPQILAAIRALGGQNSQ